MAPWISWAIFAVVLFVAEIVTPGAFFFVCIGAGALAAALVSVFTSLWWIPWAVFLIASVLFVALSRPLAHRLTARHEMPSNVDALIGQRARVIEAIDDTAGTGLVRLQGETWRAMADQPIAAEAWVTVVRVEGTRVMVQPAT